MLTTEQQQRVCASARALKGIPWRGQGRDQMGLDCSGLILVAYKNAGFPVEDDVADYRGVDSRRVVETLRKYAEWLPPETEPIPGDVVVYGIRDNRHLGLVVDGNPLNMVHVPIDKRVVEARFDRNRGPIRGFYRWTR